jgi:Skp family chaperone for outer membrane proteins
MISPRAFPLLLAVLVWQPAHAEQVYKWVDSEGRVTYSSTPPPDGAKAETVAKPLQPSPEEIQQSEERVKREEAQARELEKQRLEHEAAEREKEAEEARLRALQTPAPPVIIEKPVYVPQPMPYPPAMAPPPQERPPRPILIPVPR